MHDTRVDVPSLTSLFCAHFHSNSNEFLPVYEHELAKRFKQLIPNLQVLKEKMCVSRCAAVGAPVSPFRRVDDETWIVLIHIATWLKFDTALERHVEPQFRANFVPTTHHLGCLHTLATPAAPRPGTPRAGRISRWALFVQPNHHLFWATAAQALLPSAAYPSVHDVYSAITTALLGHPLPAPPYGRHHPAWRGGCFTDDGSGAQLIGRMPTDVLRHHLLPQLRSADVHAAMLVCTAWRSAITAVVHAATCTQSDPCDVGAVVKRLATMPALCTLTMLNGCWTMMQPPAPMPHLRTLTIQRLVGSKLRGWQVIGLEKKGRLHPCILSTGIYRPGARHARPHRPNNLLSIEPPHRRPAHPPCPA